MLALLHTSPVHVPVFDALRDLDHPDLALLHRVDASLLDRARVHGPRAVADDIGAAVADAVAAGATAVLCTCSTIGGVAETVPAAVPVLRVDRPMAAAAAAERRIVVVATVAGTVEPTVALVRDEVAHGRSPDIRALLVEDAWELFETGDREGYLDVVAKAVDSVEDADVILLAQASMADAAGRARTTIPVLSSPRPGLAAAAAAVADVRR
ncbi:aspartate/glutamate racemase family protein [Streptomyces sp. SP18CS02]|uniref:aspartate/glutamate racemase family protein n=1 Tax=Streptomyces sp. SP18CS02 TaxID=3002531 RepID=UPI002E77BBA6|nr:aspartate/glutamate racemase family protein [Streptomyces sp. SP18CS02]MEE1754496.1 arylsulfatase [Streptomyces sp. SP18CS02]